MIGHEKCDKKNTKPATKPVQISTMIVSTVPIAGSYLQSFVPDRQLSSQLVMQSTPLVQNVASNTSLNKTFISSAGGSSKKYMDSLPVYNQAPVFFNQTPLALSKSQQIQMKYSNINSNVSSIRNVNNNHNPVTYSNVGKQSMYNPVTNNSTIDGARMIKSFM